MRKKNREGGGSIRSSQCTILSQKRGFPAAICCQIFLNFPLTGNAAITPLPSDKGEAIIMVWVAWRLFKGSHWKGKDGPTLSALDGNFLFYFKDNCILPGRGQFRLERHICNSAPIHNAVAQYQRISTPFCAIYASGLEQPPLHSFNNKDVCSFGSRYATRKKEKNPHNSTTYLLKSSKYISADVVFEMAGSSTRGSSILACMHS